MKRGTGQDGSVLIMVAVGIAVLSALIDLVLVKFDSGQKNFQSFNDKTQIFYVSEGIRQISTALITNLLTKKPLATGDEIAADLRARLPGLVPQPYAVANISVTLLDQQPNALIPSGPFAGMNGPITELDIAFNVTGPSSVFGGNINDPLKIHMAIGFVSMFQFALFYDVLPGYLRTGPPLEVKGRLHSNMDMCVGGNDGIQSFQKMTVVGRLMTHLDTRCPVLEDTRAGNSVMISDTEGFSTFKSFSNAFDSGCTNCDGTGMNWSLFALKRWGGQAMDVAHGVPLLRLPSTGLSLTQTTSVDATEPIDNKNNLRFIVEPVLATDSPAARETKFANLADVRIINGVWYLRNVALEGQWPGMPIWSDHPGHYVENGIAVGQDDIRTLWKGLKPWPAAPATPRGYSYYEYNTDLESIESDVSSTGVISYGGLARSTSATTPLKPGYWLDSGDPSLCFGQPVICGGPAGCGFKGVWDADPVTCSGGIAAPGSASLILNSTRSGFVNGHIYEISPGPPTKRIPRSRILPVNFDVQQFQTALQNTAPGELGSYFSGPSSVMGGRFNGIVYIDSQWPGSLDATPTEPPAHGELKDTTQMLTTSGAMERALPQPLCSSGAMIGKFYDKESGLSRFKIPDCDQYKAGGSINSWPNAVRIVNGANLSAATLPKGLSIVSRLPVYLTGNFNTSSNATTQTSMPWLPALVAGDKVALLSNNWSDQFSRWDMAPSTVTRTAGNTTYNTAMLSDLAWNLTVLMENWDGKNLEFNGSLVFGYKRVFALHGNFCCGAQSYTPPNRLFEFDKHFNIMANQPPGAPMFPVAATITWSK